MSPTPTPPIIRDGRPYSAWDAEYERTLGAVLGPGTHAIKRVVGTHHYWDIRSAQTLHAEGKHRPGRPLRFTLEEARRIKDDYWNGEKTIAALAREYGVTTVTIHRVVHGYTYWWA